MTRSFALLFVLAASSASGQAVLRSNQITGSVTFTNANPVICDRIAQPATRLVVGAEAASLAVEALGTGTTTTYGDGTYELTVDTVDAGLGYEVQAVVVAGDAAYETAIAATQPVLPEPAPDERRDLEECAALLRLHFRHRDGSPATIRDVDVRTSPPGWRELGVLVKEPWQAIVTADTATDLELLAFPAGIPQDVVIELTIGADAYTDLLTLRVVVPVTLRCDEVVDLDVLVVDGTPGGDPLPRIVGVLDVLGEHETYRPRNDPSGGLPSSTVHALGPWGNRRSDVIDADPSSGTYELQNLLPSSMTIPLTPYLLAATACFREGARTTGVTSQLTQVTVPDTGTLDLGETFVMDPGAARADVRIAGPPGSPNPMLAAMVPFDDRDGDGRNDSQCDTLSNVQLAGGEMVPFGWWNATVESGIAATHDAATGDLTGDSLLVAGGAARGVAPFRCSRLALTFNRTDDPTDQRRWLRGWLRLGPDSPPMLMGAGSSDDFPVHACVSEVFLGVESRGVPFFAPHVEIVGGRFDGVDFEGRNASYDAQQTGGDGLPLDAAGATTQSLIGVVLPQGDWLLSVKVNTIDPSGSTSWTELVRIPLTVGCRQVVNASTEIQAEVDDLPACTGPGLVRVSGRVRSRRPVARVAWSLDGGPWTDTCAPCGVDPTFAFDVNVPTTESSLVVQAWDDSGLSASVVAFTGLTGEPSALDLVPAAVPLLVRRSPAGLALSWEPRLTDEFTIHRGTIASLHGAGIYDHASIATTCRLPGNAREIAMPPGDSYFLVTESCKSGNGSFGRDSFGRERPGPVSGCP